MIPALIPPQAPLDQLVHGSAPAAPAHRVADGDVVYGVCTVGEAGRILDRHSPQSEQLLRYRNGKPITHRRYDHLWNRIGEHLPWVLTQGVSTHWLRHTTLTWVERTLIQCSPRDPEAKGLVERANGYLETSFLPGRVFTSPADFNAQLGEWLIKANRRHHRRLECRPLDRWETDRQSMLEPPPVNPVVGWRLTTRLPRDHYVRLDSNDYSVHPAAIGRRVQVRADPEQVVVTLAGTELARHQR